MATLSGYVLDNDSYYIQTVQWLDLYGLVPGIANWHLFLAQQSGFHVLESALNFEFLGLGFNDASLFLTAVMMLWAIGLFAPQDKSSLSKAFRQFLLLPLPLLLLLGSAPSPDVPVLLLHYYVIYRFLFLDHRKEGSTLTITFLLVALACYFKITSIFLAILPVALWLQHHKANKHWDIRWLYVSVPFAVLFVVKNVIASGFPMFPLTFIHLDLDWSMPLELAQFYGNATTAQAYGVAYNDLLELNFIERFQLWYRAGGVEGYTNGIVVSILIICFVALIAYFKNYKLRVVLMSTLLMAGALFLTSPQARFFLPFLIPVIIVIGIYQIPLVKRYSNLLSYLGVVGSCILLAAPVVIGKLTDNKRMKVVPRFQVNHVIEPGPQSRYNSAFAKAKINNIIYNDPQADDFFYGTYDVPLPAAQSEYIEYFKTYFYIAPEYRGDSPRSGFRAVRY